MVTNYDVSVKVGDKLYVVLYTPRLGELPAKYATGREPLVLVGKGGRDHIQRYVRDVFANADRKPKTCIGA
jgi:hypothetical protein